MSRCSYAISSTVIATIIGGVAYFLSFKGFQLHMFRHLLPFLLHHLLQGQEPVLPELNPLVGVPHTGILYQSTKDHEETNKEVNVNGLHVGYIGQGRIDRVDEGDLYQPLHVSKHIELQQIYIRQHLHRVFPTVPGVLRSDMVNPKLSISTLHILVFMGKFAKFMGQVALMVSLMRVHYP